MLDNYEDIANLITGFNNWAMTEAEQDELDNWIIADDKHQLLFGELSDPNRLRAYLKQMEGYDERGSWEKIKRELPLTIKPVRKLFPWKKTVLAASLVLMLGVGGYYAFFIKAKKEGIAKLPESKDVEAPKGTKAMITLANGHKVSLDSLTSGTLAIQGNVNVVKTADGQIVYNGSSAVVEYNTMFNPRGSKVVNLTLSDGTKVWLNSESSLHYPTAFAGNERNVEITGEAYFEVAKDATKKFIVSGKGVTTEVLGTHFNVNTYKDESNIKVTLLEGRVKVTKGAFTGLLKPSQQAQVGYEVKVISGVDIDEVMAWKNGRFQFNKASLQEVMRQIARWYDVEISYEGNIAPQQFGGKMQRDLNLSEVLDGLAKSQVHFRIEGKKVVVMP